MIGWSISARWKAPVGDMVSGLRHSLAHQSGGADSAIPSAPIRIIPHRGSWTSPGLWPRAISEEYVKPDAEYQRANG